VEHWAPVNLIGHVGEVSFPKKRLFLRSKHKQNEVYPLCDQGVPLARANLHHELYPAKWAKFVEELRGLSRQRLEHGPSGVPTHQNEVYPVLELDDPLFRSRAAKRVLSGLREAELVLRKGFTVGCETV
jgi:hypothetical protein